MRIRFPALLTVAALATCLGAPALAQEKGGAQDKAPEAAVGPKAKPHLAGDRTQNLDFLFGALKAAPDDTIAKAIEQRIWSVWTASRSDTALVLMTRVQKAIEQKDLDLAVKLLDAIVKIKPDYVEAWNRRATLYYMRKDYGRALAD